MSILDKYLAPPQPSAPGDPYADALRKERDRASVQILSREANPERAARAAQIARENNVPSITVEQNYETFEAREKARKADLIFGMYPKLGKWAQNRDYARQSADDLDGLRDVGRVFDPKEWARVHGSMKAAPDADKSLWGALGGLWTNLTGGYDEAIAGLDMVMVDSGATDWINRNILGKNETQVRAQRAFAEISAVRGAVQAKDRIDAATPRYESTTGQAVYSGLTSLARMAPGMAMSVALRNPAPVLASAGVQSGLPAYSKYRLRGATPGEAALGGVGEGGVEIVTEMLPMGKLVSGFGKAGAGKFLRDYLGREMPTEQIATFAQDAIDTAIANPDKTWGEFMAERPSAAYSTAISVLTSTGVLAGASYVAERAAGSQQAKAAAVAEGMFLDRLNDAAVASKTQTRNPEAFRELVETLAGDGPVQNVYVAPEAIRAFQQSDRYQDGMFDPWSDQIAEAEAIGGDVVIPVAEAMALLAGDAYQALKDDIRLSAGGVSRREAATFDEAMSEYVADLGSQVEAETANARAAMTARQQVFESVQNALMNTGATPSAARQQAELVTARIATRAERMGQELTGREFSDSVEVRQVLPEGLKPLAKGDDLDVVVAAMRQTKGQRSAGQRFGPSLLEFIASRGGLNDTGGDVASMGGDKWHRGKPGRRKLIKTSQQGGFVGGASAEGLDTVLQAAMDAGYFPELNANRMDDGNAAEMDVQILLDAIGRELAGDPVYSAENAAGDQRSDEVRAAAGELRAFLEGEGYDIDTMRDADLKGVIERYGADNPDALMQSYMDNPRGRVSFGTGKSIIELFEGRNLSTFIHEMGHVWLEELQADAADPSAPQQVRDDWSTIETWFASNGHPIVDCVIPVEAHELWARGVERYTMEGKAPSSLLRKAFDAFRGWMLAIYQVVENLRSPISDEVRDVMARLIATDEEIANVAQAQALNALAGLDTLMTEAEAAAYAKSVTEARDEAYDSLLFKVMAHVRKQRTEQYRDAEKVVSAEVTADVDARREFRALAALRTGPKLDRTWLVERYGDAVLAALPKAVPPIYAEAPTSADQIAEQNGFETGDELVKALIGIENRRKELRIRGDKRSVRQSVIDEQVSSIMADRYADILNDGSIEEEALASVHDERQGELIAYELRQLGRATGRGPLPYKLAKQWAATKIASSPVREVASKAAIQQYARAAAKAGRDAQDAMLKRDVQAAFDAKQKQMLNNALISEAKAQADRIEAAVARMDKWARRRTSKTVDQDYLEQAHALLEQVDLRRRSNRAVERAESFEQWATARQAEGFDVVVPPSFADQIGRKNWTRLTVEELLGLDDAVKQVIHLGRLKKTLLDGKEKREFEAVVGEALAAAGGLNKRPPSDLMEPGWKDRAGAAIRGFDAALLKMETMFDWLDGGKSTGVFNRMIFKPIADAQDAKQDMIAEYTDKLTDLLKALPKKQIARWSERVVVPELVNRDTGRPFVFTRDQLISVALNTGNAGNMDKLTGGYGWNADAVMTALNRELTIEEWQYVQNVWDTIETLWPQIAAMEKRVNGIAPEKVDATPLDTNAGTLRGGYFPVVYDPARDYDSEAQRAKSVNLFDAVYTRAATPKGFTKERTAVKRPIHLSLGVVGAHITEVIHDLTHREAIMQADRLLSDKRVMQAVDETLGREVRKQFRPWLQNIANEYAKDRAGNAGIEKFLKAARTNTTFVGMGYRVSTVMLQVAGYSNSFERVGAKWVTAALAETTASPVETFNFVLEKSGEVRNRMTNLDRDIRDTAKRLAGKAGVLTEVQRFAFHGIGLMDRMVVVPTWMGAYRKALASGMTEAQAIYDADKAVRQSQGAGATKDLAAIQTGTGTFGELGKFLTLFYTFMSAQWQRQRTLARDTQDAVSNRRYGDFPALLARAWWLLIVPPVLSEILAGRGPDDDEDWGMWAFQRMLVNAVGPIPVVRDAASALDSGFGYKFTPVSSAFETTVNTARDVGRVAQGEETKRMTRNMLETAGYATGMVPGQFAAATQFLVDASYGEQDPESLGDWWQGLTKGKIKED